MHAQVVTKPSLTTSGQLTKSAGTIKYNTVKYNKIKFIILILFQDMLDNLFYPKVIHYYMLHYLH